MFVTIKHYYSSLIFINLPREYPKWYSNNLLKPNSRNIRLGLNLAVSQGDKRTSLRLKNVIYKRKEKKFDKNLYPGERKIIFRLKRNLFWQKFEQIIAPAAFCLRHTTKSRLCPINPFMVVICSLKSNCDKEFSIFQFCSGFQKQVMFNEGNLSRLLKLKSFIRNVNDNEWNLLKQCQKSLIF